MGVFTVSITAVQIVIAQTVIPPKLLLARLSI